MHKFKLFCLSVFLFYAFVANANNSLIVSFVTAHLNLLPDSVEGIVVTPSGNLIKTGAMGPFSSEKIVIDNPENGLYSTYYQAIIEILPNYCHIVGGIDAHLTENPSQMIVFDPPQGKIQGFALSKSIKIGEKTLPEATFKIGN